jgi:zinc protease
VFLIHNQGSFIFLILLRDPFMKLAWRALSQSLFLSAAMTVYGFCVQSSLSAPAPAPTTLPDAVPPAANERIVSQPVAAVDNTPLPQDPADVRGQFTNGLHYLIRRNANPPGKVFLNLAVRTGSLNETDQQNGLAHFLEHMAFKGSTHYAPTKLIPMLQHLGMRFGADTNAHTNQYETVFKLSMPDNRPQTLDTALTIFSDYANGLSLFPIQIESESRVILEELRSRMSVGRRESREEYLRLFPGSQMARHDVSGDPQIIKSATAPLFVDYWNKWYRPEKMTLVVVGDVDPEAIIAQARPLLGTFNARAPAQTPRTAGLVPFASDRAVVLCDPEQVTGDIEILGMQPARPVPTTVGQYRQKTIQSMAENIVNRRISGMVNSGRAPFQAARVSSGDMLHDGYLADARAQGEPNQWKNGLLILIFELKHAIDDGFTPHELDTTRDSMLAGLEQAADVESTRDSSELVTSLTTQVDTDQPIMSSRQQLEMLKKVLPTITVEELQQAFSAAFKSNAYAYVLKLPEPGQGQALPTEAQVLGMADSAWKVQTRASTRSSIGSTTRSTTQTATSMPLLPPEPPPGKVTSRQTDADLALTTATFENGVVMHHRFSDYRKDQVLVQIDLPGGVLEETSANRGISSLASMLLDRPATSHLTSGQIRSAMGDRIVGMHGTIGLDSLSISVSAAPKDLPWGMQLVGALLTDGKLEQLAVDRWKTLELQSLRGKPMLAEPQVSEALSATVTGDDPRFKPLTAENVNHLQRAAAQAWFQHIADHSAIEVSIVGDLSVDDAVSLVGKSLGSLPKRAGSFTELDALRDLSRDVGPYVRIMHYSSMEPKALVMAGFIACDEHDPDRRPLSLASQILTDRMVQHIRFDQQLVYSISCTLSPSRGFPGVGMISARAPTDPKNADKLADDIINIMKDFAASGPTEDELSTAKKQIANQLTTQMKDPRYWLAQFSELEYHHKSLADMKLVPGIYDTFTAAQVRDAMRKYATDNHLIRIEVLPDQPSTAPASSTSQPVSPN